MKRYEEYKDTGVKWIPKIPKHWNIEPFGRHFTYGKGLPITKADLIQEGIPVISYGQIHSKLNRGTTISDELVRYVSPMYLSSNPNSLLKSGDFIFADTSEDIEGSGNFAYNDYETNLFAGYHTLIARPIDLVNTKYLAYLFLSKPWKNQVQSLVNGVKVYSIGKRHLKKSILLFPPLAEQEKIVSYLEDKTAKIDALIEELSKQIKLLNELKESEIANIITRGLNPDVKMKESGIPWIGMIPEHWEIKKISSLFKERREKVSDKVFQALSVSKQGITLQLETAVKTDNGDNRKKVCVGDFVVNSRSDRKGSCGISPFDGSVSLINIVLQPRNFIEGKFFHYLFRSNNYIEEYYRLGRGIVADLWTTRYSEMKNILVPLPPLEEQRAIVNYIEDKCNKVNSLISELETEIEYLKEYKQKLIADCVTGQIDVRNM